MTDNKLNIVVIGCSPMARRHMEGVCAHGQAVLYGVCDIHDDVLLDARDALQVPRITHDYMDFVRDPAVDAAIIAILDEMRDKYVR